MPIGVECYELAASQSGRALLSTSIQRLEAEISRVFKEADSPCLWFYFDRVATATMIPNK